MFVGGGREKNDFNFYISYFLHTDKTNKNMVTEFLEDGCI